MNPLIADLDWHDRGKSHVSMRWTNPMFLLEKQPDNLVEKDPPMRDQIIIVDYDIRFLRYATINNLDDFD